MSELDHFVKDRLRVKKYLRYMDDLILYGEKDELFVLLHRIRHFLKETLKLELKEKATRIAPVTEGVPFLGFRIFPGITRLKRENLVRLRRKFRARESSFASGQISEEKLIQSVGSMFAFVKYAHSANARRRILEHSLDLA